MMTERAATAGALFVAGVWFQRFAGEYSVLVSAPLAAVCFLVLANEWRKERSSD